MNKRSLIIEIAFYIVMIVIAEFFVIRFQLTDFLLASFIFIILSALHSLYQNVNALFGKYPFSIVDEKILYRSLFRRNILPIKDTKVIFQKMLWKEHIFLKYGKRSYMIPRNCVPTDLQKELISIRMKYQK